MKVYCKIVKYKIDKRKKETVLNEWEDTPPTHFKFALYEGAKGAYLLSSEMKEVGHKTSVHNFTFGSTSWGWSMQGGLFIYNKEIDM